MRVLRARGIESEAQIPFAALLELLRPALAMLDAIPEPQAIALEGALALRRGPAQERFAVGAATLSLLAAYAEEEPVAVLVDDAHWLDGSSAQALLFAFRRLVADPIAVLIAVREGDPSLLDGADLPTMRRRRADERRGGDVAARPHARGGRATARSHRRQPARADRTAPTRRRISPSRPQGPRCSSPRGSRAHFCGASTSSTTPLVALGAGGDQRQRRSVDARAGGESARDRSRRARGRRGRRARHAEAGIGRVPPPAGPVGDLRGRTDRGASRRPSCPRRGAT